MRNIIISAILAWASLVSLATAGGGPENVFLVVNSKSQGSLTIANNYIQLRHIPPGNVFYLPYKPDYDVISIESLRTDILKPIFEAIRSRRLSAQIDYIVYSSDFPWKIDYSGDLKAFSKLPMQTDFTIADEAPELGPFAPNIPLGKQVLDHPSASLNGLTYLAQSVLKGEPDYLDMRANRYFRVPMEGQKDMPTLGFRSGWQFGPQGDLVESQGKNYMLSVMLGVTVGRGNSVQEVLKYLKRSASADGTQPNGTIYFVKKDDIRSKVRQDFFPGAVKQLEQLGVSAQIIKGIEPTNKKDVQGVVMGTSDFNWSASDSTILPGAICDNFTSYGGIMNAKMSQTPLSEYLRYGAAGASGTVAEPFAIINKFPFPMIQVHYARGCTLAEAFYQSVFAPYQLLIVGDPLCRPWATIPQVKLSGIKPDHIVKGTLSISPSATTAQGHGIDHFELFVNGSRAAMCKPDGTLTLDTTLLPDGFQELRVVAVESGLIQSQGRAILSIITENHGRKIDAKLLSQDVIRPDNPLIIDVNSPASIGISVLQNSRIVGRVAGDKGQVTIQADQLGAGPVRLQIIGIGNEGPRSHVIAPPIDVTVEIPEKEKAKDS